VVRFFLLLSVLILTACTPRPVLAPLPEGVTADKTLAVFTATNRAPAPDNPGVDRSKTLGFERLDIAIPADRPPGSIETPRRRNANPGTDFLLADRAAMADKRAFRRALSAHLRKLPPEDRDVLIYVHGFNQTFANGVLRMAQLNHDLNLRGAAVHFSWPSAANPFAYAYDRDSALFSRDALEEVLKLVRVPEARRVGVIAHSMGSFLTMEALRQMALRDPGSAAQNVDGVILISPDIDVEVFRTQAESIGALPEAFAVFLSDRDRALSLSARLTGQRVRLGNLDDAKRLEDLRVAFVDVSAFSEGSGHFTAGTSPALLSILASAAAVDNAFAGDAAGRSGLLPGTVLSVQNVTEFVLTAGTNR
jgi:esterase/lipase superfamily enzyme